MQTPEKKELLAAAGLALGCALGLKLLPLALPVLLGIAGAAALDPMILRLQERTGMGRGAAAFWTVSAALGVLTGLIFTLGRALLHEAQGLSRQLPALLETLSGYAEALSIRLSGVARGLPDGIGDALSAWAQELGSGGGALAERLYDGLFSLVSGLLSALPGSAFFLMTLLLSWYFAAGELPRLRELAGLYLPPALAGRLDRALFAGKTALGLWLRAQLLLMGVTFCVLLLGFLVLRVRSPLLLALGVALLDALPLFGTGTVLIPWAFCAIGTGSAGLGAGLMGLYGAAALLRNILEPRLLGAQLGLSPLLTLLAIYAGWRLGGFWGMLLLPMAAMVLSQLLVGARHPSPRQSREAPRSAGKGQAAPWSVPPGGPEH